MKYIKRVVLGFKLLFHSYEQYIRKIVLSVLKGWEIRKTNTCGFTMIDSIIFHGFTMI